MPPGSRSVRCTSCSTTRMSWWPPACWNAPHPTIRPRCYPPKTTAVRREHESCTSSNNWKSSNNGTTSVAVHSSQRRSKSSRPSIRRASSHVSRKIG
ncbi:hypothetical protein [Nocardia sp. BMG51109]|uniref:zinc finger domain-containing protein n=1 Tax=Nocardia sp. BMG51109 TaxID=1056816 RepID=UPI00350F5F42